MGFLKKFEVDVPHHYFARVPSYCEWTKTLDHESIPRRRLEHPTKRRRPSIYSTNSTRRPCTVQRRNLFRISRDKLAASPESRPQSGVSSAQVFSADVSGTHDGGLSESTPPELLPPRRSFVSPCLFSASFLRLFFQCFPPPPPRFLFFCFLRGA